MRCPRCPDPLYPFFLEEQVDVDGEPRPVVLDGRQCARCRGVFFDEAQLQAASAVVKVGAIEVRRIAEQDPQRGPPACPACEVEVAMEPTVSARDARVVIDVCPRCSGAWLDAGELAALQQESLWSLLVGGGRRR